MPRCDQRRRDGVRPTALRAPVGHTGAAVNPRHRVEQLSLYPELQRGVRGRANVAGRKRGP